MLLESSPADFQIQFKQRLSKMLSPNELGTFILVLANSMQDTHLQAALAPRLKSTFKDLEAIGNLHAAPDDLAVFNAIKSIGISQYLSQSAVWKTRSLGEDYFWQCTYNPIRALRPARASKESFSGIQKPFNEETFHFNKAFLRAEILSEETFENTPIRVMYHKFPFVPYHLLIVIEAALHRAQYLDQNIHQLTWNLANQVTTNIPGFGIAYNSLGAGASINHLHIHSFVDKTLLSIEKSIWEHNGGPLKYPVQATYCKSSQESWQQINRLHNKNTPYNLLYRDEVCYIIERKPQGSATLPTWMPSPGWFEACGGFNLDDQTLFEKLTQDEVEAGLSLLRID